MPESPRKNIVLTGFMAVGKSVVGEKLAHRLQWPFVDLDLAIEAREGMKVHDIFASKGETYFRNVEKRLLQQLLSGKGRVIATGGGAIMDEGNLGLIKAESLLICLTAQAETLLARSRGGSKRPLLAGGEKLNNIKDLLHKRAAAYNQAHLKVDTEGRSVDEVVEQIIQVIKQSDD